MQALPALTTQVQLLTDRQLSLETQFCQPTPLPRSQLENPLSSAMPTVGKPNLSKLAKAMPSPPRTQPQQPLGMLAAVLDKPAAVVELETEKEKQDMPENSNLAQAVLAQSQALTALVSQIASVSQDPMNDLTSVGATAGTRGAHAGKGEIASGACPTQRSVLHRSASSHVPPDGPYFQLRHHTTTDASSRNLRNQVRREIRRIWEDERMGDAPIPGADRFGFSGGQHQCGEGHSGTIGGDFYAQGVLDLGRLEIASLLCLLGDVPSGVFMNRQLTAASRSRTFAPLADQKWITCALAYLKEMDVIINRRQEFIAGGGGRAPTGLPSEDAQTQSQSQLQRKSGSQRL